MPALPTAKRQMLRSLGVTRDGRAVEGLLASCEALTRGDSLWAVSFLCLRVSGGELQNRVYQKGTEEIAAEKHRRIETLSPAISSVPFPGAIGSRLFGYCQ